MTTLAFVSPASVLPVIVKQLQADLDPTIVNSLTDVDHGVWSTPEGSIFVDGSYFLNCSVCLFLLYPQCFHQRMDKFELPKEKMPITPNGTRKFGSPLQARRRLLLP